jgi:predicted DNA-binding protein (MmcQ/YjbR family)
VVQWGDADVWKVGKAEPKKNKVFVVGGWNKDSDSCAVSFHCSDIAFDMLRDAPGCRPAPYLASRGMTWIQRCNDESVPDSDLKDYIENSHRLMRRKLTKSLQRELGFLDE